MLTHKSTYLITLALVAILNISVYSQEINIVNLETNSASKNDFAPFVKDSILYFTTNRKHELIKTYLNRDNEWVYRLYKSDILPNEAQAKETPLQNPQLSKLNTASICWSADTSTIVITQNQYSTVKRSKGRQNLLGIFFITNKKGEWSRPSAFKYNSRRNYSNVHPTITPDGKTIYFVSDKPGGIGKADIYESSLVNGEWTEPVNLGRKVNTEGNEVFPFYHSSGKLYFSSEGHNSTGKLDIFYTSKNNGVWSAPIKLEYPINTESNDFSCYIYDSQTEGYFASDRTGNADIFKFNDTYPKFPDASPQIEDNFCFTLFENGPYVSDTLPYKYKWNFGDGATANGLEVDHCFPGPGKYLVELNVVDTLANKDLYTVASYEVNLERTPQIYITAPDTVNIGTSFQLSTDISTLQDFVPTQYFWDFGDGNKAKGVTIHHIFRKKGIYTITCGAISKLDPTDKRSSTRQIVVIE
ncbi:PKD domain-containing protein [Saccharicrinis fermentans]|uniref:Polycystin cation channel protein n=1 Tax=Saccharicrinis fermentans DSM 9555 = JCM 21142 TaxID=869213 RepID=W7Y2A5_9BACT|nr:PKD domain-containing protein [Saccharicrinis fermentans]GAF01668.1 polycystin cation channel protein [Saccharicrinis fermentans DSM 9555 = JCM 21142]